jgi:hypothetical protein
MLEGVYKGTPKQIGATLDGEATVRAITETTLEHASAKGEAYIWSTSNGSSTAGDTKLFIKNTSDKFLVFSRIFFNPSNVLCRYELGIGSATTTPTGTEITATNMNGTISVPESYLAYETETAVADATKSIAFTVGTTDMKTQDLDGFIIGKNQYLQINCETTVTSGSVEVEAHFETDLI